MDVAVVALVARSCLTLLWLHGQQPTGLLCPWDFPGKNTGVGCRFLLQGIFPTQGLNLCLLHWQADSLLVSPPGKPKIWIQICYSSALVWRLKWENISDTWEKSNNLPSGYNVYMLELVRGRKLAFSKFVWFITLLSTKFRTIMNEHPCLHRIVQFCSVMFIMSHQLYLGTYTILVQN